MISVTGSRPASVIVTEDPELDLPGRLYRQGLIDDLDLHFSRFIARLAARPSEGLLLASLLVSSATGDGHVCVNLPALAGQPLFGQGGDIDRRPATPTLGPSWPVWAAALWRSGVVGKPGDYKPLILEQGRLYLYRYWRYEQRLIDDLRRRAAATEPVDNRALEDGLAALFPADDKNKLTNRQRQAAETAVRRRLCVISGGPGTGKTTTVVRILALLVSQNPAARIALAAPTGKAAARLQDAIRGAKRQLPLNAELRELIPEQATTLHRLLGSQPQSVYFRHHRGRPLTLEVLVVDEASMVDLALLAKLIDALPVETRLILLGDKDQLASVEAGAVLGDICGSATGAPATEAPAAGASAAGTPAAETPADAPLAASVVMLKHSYRFAGDSGIGSLARAINDGDGGRALALLGSQPDLGWRTLSGTAQLRHAVAELLDGGLGGYLTLARSGAAPADIFAAFERSRLLTALRGGPFGADACNRLIESLLAGRGLLDGRRPWYTGRPVMITRNHHGLRLYNGDIGIALPDPDDGGRLKVFFPHPQDGTGRPRRFGPNRLPPHETVYALTVHKSQGSEFDRVTVLLPPEPSRVLSRELLYTGITRARQRVEVWASEASFFAATGRRIQRASGLRDALWPASAARRPRPSRRATSAG